MPYLVRNKMLVESNARLCVLISIGLQVEPQLEEVQDFHGDISSIVVIHHKPKDPDNSLPCTHSQCKLLNSSIENIGVRQQWSSMAASTILSAKRTAWSRPLAHNPTSSKEDVNYSRVRNWQIPFWRMYGLLFWQVLLWGPSTGHSEHFFRLVTYQVHITSPTAAICNSHALRAEWPFTLPCKFTYTIICLFHSFLRSKISCSRGWEGLNYIGLIFQSNALYMWRDVPETLPGTTVNQSNRLLKRLPCSTQLCPPKNLLLFRHLLWTMLRA